MGPATRTTKASKEAQEVARSLARERLRTARLQYLRAQRQQQQTEQAAAMASDNQCNVSEATATATATFVVL